MCFQQFGSLYLCHDLGTGFMERSFSGQWSKKGVRVTGVLRLTTEAETFVSVSQVGRRQLRGEVKRARMCKERDDSRDVYRVRGEGLGPARLVEGAIQWGELSPSLAVVTQ